MASTFVEYMCSHCGAKKMMHVVHGKPQPGRCPKRKNGKPHVWTVNRRM